MNKDTFLFKMKFEAKGLIKKKSPPKTLNLTVLEMFNYYINYLNSKHLDKSDLISCVQKILEQYKEFDIKTYLSIFIECSTPVSIQRHLDLYKQNNIIEGENMDDDTKQKFQNHLNLWEMSPEEKLKDLNKEREEDNKFKLYSIILYFNYLFNKNRIKEMIDNKQINEYIFRVLIKYDMIFREISLTKQHVQNMIDIVENFDELLKVLKYNNFSLLEFLKIINDNIIKINNLNKLLLEECHKKKIKREKIPFINILNFAIPYNFDDINEISKYIFIIVNKIKNFDKYLFIYFPPSFFKFYMDIYRNVDLEKLIIIKDIIDLIKINDKRFEINDEINDYIHNIGINQILDEKMAPIQILKFVKKDSHYYSPKSKYVKDSISLIIFNNMNIREMDKEFIKEWNTIDWINIFGDEYLNFAKAIINLVKVMEDFHILLLLLHVRKLTFVNANTLITWLQNQYIELYRKTYKKEECPHFIEDSEELIFLTDKISKNISFFLTGIFQNIINPDLIYDVYKSFIKNNENISTVAENTIVFYLLKNSKIIDYNFFNYFLQKCQNSREIIISYIQKHAIKEEDVFSLENTDNLIIYKILSNHHNNYSLKDKSLENYNNENETCFNFIKKIFDNYDIIYNYIEKFFKDEQTENVFKDRLLILYLKNEKRSEEKFNSIKERFKEAKEIMNGLKILIEDQKVFYKHKNTINIEDAEKLIEKIKKSDLNFCRKDQKIKEYSQFIKDAVKREPEKNSLIFMQIYNNKKERLKNDVKLCLQKSYKRLIEFKPYFMNINKNIDLDLKNIIQSLEFDEEKINNEANNLMKIFNLKSESDKNKLINSILCLKYKEKIIKLLSSLKIIIESTNVEKGLLSKLIDTILSYLKKEEIVSTIQMAIKIMKNYSIDIYDEEDIFIKIMLKISNVINEEKIKNEENLNNKDYEERKQFIEKFKVKNKEHFAKNNDKELLRKIKDEIVNSKSIF